MNPLRSVEAKISVLTSLFVLAIIGWMSQGILLATEETFLAEMRVRSQFFARSTREAIFPKVDPFNLTLHVSELIKEKAVTYAAVMDADGRYLSHSDPSLIGEKPADALSARAVASDAPVLQTFRDPKGGESFDLATPIVVGTKRVGTARVGFSRSSIDEALRAPKRRLLIIALAAILASISGTIFIVGWITRPLPLLAAAAREAARGNFSVQVEWKSRDEVGILARAFNEMTTANALLFAAIRQEKEKLETVFDQTREGIIWARSDGHILLANRSARAFLGLDGKPTARLSDALQGFSAAPPLEDLFRGRARTTACEFTRKEPKPLVLSGVADRLGSDAEPAGLLFVLRDATIEKREEGLARNFLSLVSHKLRTPLAVALGYLEMVRADSPNFNAFQNDAVRKIEAENEKLRSLVEKLLLFTTVQSPEAIRLVKSLTRMDSIVAGALKPLAPLLEKTDAKVRWDPDALSKIPPFEADGQMLEESLKNLVDNAIKFNPAAEKTVFISTEVQGSWLRVGVRDNGPGIPPEEHPKLFKKFYQVEKDFTGQIPGMGLGLAFVKNAVEAHGGKAGLSSEPGKGSEFFFTIPIPAS